MPVFPRTSRLKTAIIGLLFAVFASGCSNVRLAYNTAPQLTWWWLDGYVDFSRDETPKAKRAIDAFYDWHRRTQLPDYAAWLAALPAQAPGDVTAAQVCRWQQQIREKLEPALQQALVLGNDLVPGLGEPQFKALQRKYGKANETFRDDFLDPDREERADKAFKRVVERSEKIYGNLEEPQKRVIREGLAASPFDGEAVLAERQRAQRDTLSTLRKLVADKPGADERLAALRALSDRIEKPNDAAYRAYQQKVAEFNCGFIARIHNATNAKQRAKARDTVKGWERDLRELAAEASK